MWLNFGYVLRLQVADSIPAQVSGSQSVSCVFAVIHPTLFLPLLEHLALPRNWKTVGMDSAAPPFPLFLASSSFQSSVWPIFF